MITVTAVIKARNEAAQLAACLASLEGFATEIIIVDDASTDGTPEIARALGAKVIPITDRGERPLEWLDIHGFKAASSEWIVQMDADERMTPSLAAKLKSVAGGRTYQGVRYARKNFIWGAWIRHGGWFMADQLRFFRKASFDDTWNFAIHSQPKIQGPILTLPLVEEYATLHYDYNTVEQFVRRTLLGYAKTDALSRYGSGQRFNLLRLIVKPKIVFLGRYFVRQGLRDGIRGLALALFLALYAFLVELHLWDINRKEKEPRA